MVTVHFLVRLMYCLAFSFTHEESLWLICSKSLTCYFVVTCISPRNLIELNCGTLNFKKILSKIRTDLDAEHGCKTCSACHQLSSSLLEPTQHAQT